MYKYTIYPVLRVEDGCDSEWRGRGWNAVRFSSDNCLLHVFVLLTHAVCILVCSAWFALMFWLVVICSWWPVSLPGFEQMAVRPVARARCVTEGSVQF